MGRRSFTREFKLESVRLVTERGVSCAKAARDLGLHANVLRKWIKDHAKDACKRFLAEASSGRTMRSVPFT
jgi:transposase